MLFGWIRLDVVLDRARRSFGTGLANSECAPTQGDAAHQEATARKGVEHTVLALTFSLIQQSLALNLNQALSHPPLCWTI